MGKLKGWRTIISGALILVAGGIIQYQAGCDAGTDAAMADLCTKVTVPGWLVSALGGAVIVFRKLAGTGK